MGDTSAMTYARQWTVPAGAPGTYHCLSRCVRRAFLCGLDDYTGRSFEHRKAWIEQRLLELADIFAVSLHAYAVMSNHLHLVITVHPEAIDHWSDHDIAQRWLRLFPVRDNNQRLQALLLQPERLAVLRQRLGNLSWFMRCLNEPIARRANAEDDCTGRFWEGRFKCQVLLDEHAVLAAMAYVDLNPIRAGIATELNDARHTSAKARIGHVQSTPQIATAPLSPMAGLPIAITPLRTIEYLELLAWTGRQAQPNQPGRRKTDPPPALARLGIRPPRWLLRVKATGSGYYRALGSAQALIDKAHALGQQWLKGVGLARQLERV